MTLDTPSLRAEALRLFDVAIKAADPAAALRRHLKAPIAANGGRVIVIAVGKAACPMMREALGHITGPVDALAVTNPENHAHVTGATVMAAGHPVPDENGLNAARAVAELLGRATAQDRVIALISGGGSALLPLPVAGVNLADKAKTSEILLGAGVDIVQMNLVRQHLSQLKGGGMARFAAPARIEAYILSDVIGDDLRAIASGPTVAPIGTKAQARAVLGDVWDALPQSVQNALGHDAPPMAGPIGDNTLICSNRISLEAMQTAHPNAQIVDDQLVGEVAQVAPKLAKIAANAKPGDVLLFGGETTVTLTGKGKGGRNQDLALRMALAGIPGDWVFLSGGTDGRDGPTDAAGGLVDQGSLARMGKAGVDAGKLLQNNDAYHALQASGDLVITGGTGTNVADVQIVIRS